MCKLFVTALLITCLLVAVSAAPFSQDKGHGHEEMSNDPLSKVTWMSSHDEEPIGRRKRLEESPGGFLPPSFPDDSAVIYIISTTCTELYFTVADASRGRNFDGGQMSVYAYKEGDQPTNPTVLTVDQCVPGFLGLLPTFTSFFDGLQSCGSVIINATLRSNDGSMIADNVHAYPMECPCDTAGGKGDPHYEQCDQPKGEEIDGLNGDCEYVLSKDCVNGVYAAYVTHSHTSPNGARRIQRLRLEFGKHNVVLYANRTIIVDGEIIDIENDAAFGTSDYQLIITRRDGDRLLVEALGTHLSFEMIRGKNPQANVFWKGGVYKNSTCGFLGNCNDNPEDDFLLPNGTQANTLKEFEAGWTVPGSCPKEEVEI